MIFYLFALTFVVAFGPNQLIPWAVGLIILGGLLKGFSQGLSTSKAKRAPGKHKATANWDHLTDPE